MPVVIFTTHQKCFFDWRPSVSYYGWPYPTNQWTVEDEWTVWISRPMHSDYKLGLVSPCIVICITARFVITCSIKTGTIFFCRVMTLMLICQIEIFLGSKILLKIFRNFRISVKKVHLKIEILGRSKRWNLWIIIL